MLFSPAPDRATDRDLLLRTHRGDDRAARELWSRSGPRLIAYATALLDRHGGRAAAEDAVQSAFCRILEADRRDLRAVRDVPAWLTTLTRHAALNARRGEQREVHRRSAAVERGGGPGGAIDVNAASQATDDLHARLDALDDELREVVLLKHAAGLTFDQIALTLAQNRSTISSRYRRAIETLRAQPARPRLTDPSLSHSGAA